MFHSNLGFSGLRGPGLVRPPQGAQHCRTPPPPGPHCPGTQRCAPWARCPGLSRFSMEHPPPLSTSKESPQGHPSLSDSPREGVSPSLCLAGCRPQVSPSSGPQSMQLLPRMQAVVGRETTNHLPLQIHVLQPQGPLALHADLVSGCLPPFQLRAALVLVS